MSSRETEDVSTSMGNSVQRRILDSPSSPDKSLWDAEGLLSILRDRADRGISSSPRWRVCTRVREERLYDRFRQRGSEESLVVHAASRKRILVAHPGLTAAKRLDEMSGSTECKAHCRCGWRTLLELHHNRW